MKNLSENSSPFLITWRRFKQNMLGITALSVVLLAVLLAIFAYLIIPDNSPDANRQLLEISTRKPGFKVQMLLVPKENQSPKAGFFKRIFFGQAERFNYYPIDSLQFSSGYLSAKIFNPDADFSDEWLQFPYTSWQMVSNNTADFQKLINQNYLHTQTFWLGTDQFGRDLLSRLVLGARVSLSVGFIAVLISLLVGVTLGSLGGYFGGRTDDIVVWLINVVWSVPTLLMVIAITFALGKGFWQIFLAVGLTMWVEVARVVRGQILSLREAYFIEASKALGYNNFRIISRHILPNIMSPVIVISAANFASAILIEAGLSFLGLGVQPPTPSWGSMIKENYAFIILDAAYLALLPGLVIMLLVLAFMLIGNALRDAMDVKK
ncbi:MAG: ABC transporter permease [Bacteroidales bacterium]|nr:ABC transporter permease [Bacteroidales bacterium]